MIDGIQPLVQFARRKTGQGLRAVIRYTSETTDVHYVRDDLSEDTVRDRMAAIAADTLAHPERDPAAATYGSIEASIQLREAGHIVILREDDALVLLTFESYAGRNLGTFLKQSRRVLQEIPTPESAQA